MSRRMLILLLLLTGLSHGLITNSAFASEEAATLVFPKSQVIKELTISSKNPKVLIEGAQNKKYSIVIEGKFTTKDSTLLLDYKQITPVDGTFKIDVPLTDEVTEKEFVAISDMGELEKQTLGIVYQNFGLTKEVSAPKDEPKPKKELNTEMNTESKPADSGQEPWVKRWFKPHVEPIIYLGYSIPNIKYDNQSTKLLQTALGAILGARFKDMGLIGVTSDFRYLSHISKPNLNGVLTGTRWNIVSPVIGVYYKKYFARVDYQFLGNYNLIVKTSQNNKLRYTDPTGIRIAAAYNLWRSFYIGGFYETISFKGQEEIGETKTTVTSLADDPMKVWQAGVVVSYRLF